MRLIDALERVLERLVERPAARLFRGPLEPLQLQRRLERAMETGRAVTDGRVLVPDRYRVRLHPDDAVALGRAAPHLAADLGRALAAHSRGRGYYLRRAPEVELEADPGTPRGEPLVTAPLEPEWRAAGPVAAPDARPDGATAVYAVAPVTAPEAVLVIEEPGRGVRRVPIAGGRLRIGRARDNDLVLADGRVSRHHGELRARHGTLVYTDLGSLNGTWLGGSPVRELALGPGDRLELGGTAITVEPA
ncbi:MAG: hypothetical protein A2X23_06480 [Chloroflexi bacterium GWC2_73_18]|nr:MAG: hypothetical protein A2X23_06480 [Chloroflexi bacterium GWC2_73_18]